MKNRLARGLYQLPDAPLHANNSLTAFAVHFNVIIQISNRKVRYKKRNFPKVDSAPRA